MQPKPRDANLLRSILISLYGAFFPFLLYRMMQDYSVINNSYSQYFMIQIIGSSVICFSFVFFLLHRRQSVYNFLCRIFKRQIKLFEFGFFCLICFPYGFLTILSPFFLKIVNYHDISSVFTDNGLAMYILFSGGATLTVSAIAGFDIYPVNVFPTKQSLQHLIAITRDLMKLSNRVLVVVTGAIVIGWVFRKIPLKIADVYVSVYGIVGFAFGSSGALAIRITDLLYELSKVEMEEQKRCLLLDGKCPGLNENHNWKTHKRKNERHE